MELFLNDESLKPLYPAAIQNPKIGAGRFENNLFPAAEGSGSKTNEPFPTEQAQDVKDPDQSVEISDREALSDTLGDPDSDNGYFLYNNRVFEFTPGTTASPPEWTDRIKEIVEIKIGCPVIWWPLQPRKTLCHRDQTRVSWKCVSWRS